MTKCLTTAVALCCLLSANAGDITGKITLNGTPPPEIPYKPLKADPNCGKLVSETPTTEFYVVGKDNGLGDVVVELKGIEAKSTGASAPAVEIDQKGCLYTPQILAVQTGQKIIVKNSDPVLHNVHTMPEVAGNEVLNQAQMPGGPELTFSFAKPEEFVKVKCDVHPWMFAWITVVDNPYFAVTDKDGNFKIANVPPGKYTLVAKHRKAGEVSKEIEVTDGGAKADMEIELKK